MKYRGLLKKAVMLLLVLCISTVSLLPVITGTASSASSDSLGLEYNKIYYAETLTVKERVEADIDSYYTISESDDINVYTRKEASPTNWQSEIPFLMNGSYKDFVLDFDIEFSDDIIAEQYLWISFGSKAANSFDADKGSTVLAIGTSGIEKDSNCKLFYQAARADGGELRQEWLDPGKFDGSAKHHVRMVVLEGIMTVIIDNGVFQKSKELETTYEGGYVGVGTGYSGISFSNIVFSDPSAVGNIFFASKSIQGSRNLATVSDYYDITEDGDTVGYTRKSSSKGTWVNNVPFIFGDSYIDFTLEFDFEFSESVSGEQYLWVTFGNQKKTSYTPDTGSSAVSIGVSNAGENAECKIFFNGATANGGALNNWLNPGSFDGSGTHHAKLSVFEGVLTINIDNGLFIKNKDLDTNYVGGYVGIGTGLEKAVISDIRYSDSASENGAFFAPFANQGARSVVEADDYYSIIENDSGVTYERKSDLTGTWVYNVPFVFDGSAENFLMEFDYKFPENVNGDQYLWVSFGNKKRTQFEPLNGAAVLGIGSSNTVNDEAECKLFLRSTKADGTELNQWISPGLYTGNQKHHIQIKLSGKTLQITVDYGKYVKTATLDTNYEGGYVGIGANYAGTVISDYSVIDLDKIPDLECYYTDDIINTAKKTGTIKTYYKIDEYEMIRNSNQIDLENAVSMLYDKGYYKDFDMKLQYSVPECKEENKNFVWLAYGNFDPLNSHISAAEQGAGLLKLGYYKVDDKLFCRVTEIGADGEKTGEAFEISELKNQNINLKILEGKLELTLNSAVIYSTDITPQYSGGYVGFGTGYNDVSFSNLSINSASSIEDKFTAYFTNELRQSEILSEESIDSHWMISGDSFVRKANDVNNGNDTGNMAALYYNVSQYENFELKVNYRSTGEKGCYVGVGSEMGKSWYTDAKAPADRTWEPDDGNNIVFLLNNGLAKYGPTASYLGGTNPDTWYYDSWLTKAGTLFTTDEEKNALHTLRLRVEEGVLTVWIDEKCQGSAVLPEYKKGYVYFASNQANVTFTDLQITDYDNEAQYDFTGYTGYHSADVRGGLEECDPNLYWRINSNGNLETKSIKNTVTYDYLDMSYLLLNENKYTDFELDLDYKHGSTAWRRVYIGFGATPGESWREKDGGVMTTVQTEGIFEFNGNLDANGEFKQSICWSYRDEEGKLMEQIVPYDVAEWHHMHMEVSGGIVTVKIDDFNWEYEYVLSSDYEGGYIFLASNSSAAEFRNIKIIGMDNPNMEIEDLGWQPTDEDVAFDFSIRNREGSVHRYTAVEAEEILTDTPATGEDVTATVVSCAVALISAIVCCYCIWNIKAFYKQKVDKGDSL